LGRQPNSSSLSSSSGAAQLRSSPSPGSSSSFSQEGAPCPCRRRPMRRLTVVGQDRPRRSLDEDKDAPPPFLSLPYFFPSLATPLLLLERMPETTAMDAARPRRSRTPRSQARTPSKPPPHADPLCPRNRAAALRIAAAIAVLPAGARAPPPPPRRRSPSSG
jgi:hypothetical protein